MSVTRFITGLFGYLAALVAFLWIGILTGGADPGDSLAAGLAAALLIALLATVAVLVTSWRRQRTGQPIAASLAGMVAGLLLTALLTVRVYPVMRQAASTCPCEAIIDQGAAASLGDG
ncbi:hypothetical protein [Actinoplanes flavus]|uniref:Uncharacterized protein n=1 Tax=Actinoplanes flavus TaxID=2820290 RepID=A0ABS3UWX8_9ACTN|nr:hypothetical protein [Actinoplanes flavus]MBO3743087.1 hypothetical protein [Actinoplanes flavus]